VGLLVLLVALVPLGSTILRVGERAIGRRFAITVVERSLLSFYAGGAVFFVVGSLPVPLLGAPLVWGAIAIGAASFLGLQWHAHFRPLTSALRWLVSPAGMILSALVLGLLALEVIGTGSFAFGNAFDAGFQSLVLKLIVTNHTVPLTLQPYAPVGVLYPAGTTVWLSLPVLMFDWPIASAPVTVPLLFLALSVVGGYCWGERLSGVGTRRGVTSGLVFAGVMSALASWPRFYIGGSYDFVLAVPLFLLTLGLLPVVAAENPSSGSTPVALGMLFGVSISLSLAAGEALLALAVAFFLVHRVARGWAGFTRSVRDFAILVGFSLVFIGRSLLGLALWWSYPSHTLAPAGPAPFAPEPPLPSFASQAVGRLDPFVPWKPRMSPIPALSLELQVLLIAGLVVLGIVFVAPRSLLAQTLPQGWRTSLPAVTVTMFAVCVFLLFADSTSLGASLVGGFSNLDEESILLFWSYQAIGAIPLVLAAELSTARNGGRFETRSDTSVTTTPARLRPARAGSGAGRARAAVWASVVVLIVAFGSGSVITAYDAPAYLSGHLEMFANVSSADVAALEWSGAHLPSCSRVLVAPGSAGMYLPLYANVQLLLPMIPPPANLSYYVAVSNLTEGVITGATTGALVELNVTEVLTTGQTSVSYPPFDPEPLRESGDFETLYADGDAEVFGFLAGISNTGCAPLG
jgi:hypothetical protein